MIRDIKRWLNGKQERPSSRRSPSAFMFLSDRVSFFPSTPKWIPPTLPFKHTLTLRCKTLSASGRSADYMLSRGNFLTDKPEHFNHLLEDGWQYFIRTRAPDPPALSSPFLLQWASKLNPHKFVSSFLTTNDGIHMGMVLSDLWNLSFKFRLSLSLFFTDRISVWSSHWKHQGGEWDESGFKWGGHSASLHLLFLRGVLGSYCDRPSKNVLFILL